jgi:hypothetical protein
MGTFRVTLEIAQQEEGPFQQADALADKGVFYTWPTTPDENMNRMPQCFSLGCGTPPQAKALGHRGYRQPVDSFSQERSFS